ncbi:MAG: lipopolysaccharide biosynthesis protein [Agathobacter sp.]
MNNKALKSSIWYTISNFLVKSIGFITTPIFTRLLTKEEFGIFNSYSSWLAILTIFVTLNLEATLASARYDYEDKFDEYILSVLALSSISALVWIAIVNIFSEQFTRVFDLNRTYINAMMIYLLFLPAVNLFQSRERFSFEYKKNVAISLFLSVGTSILSVLLVLIMENRLEGRIFGSVVPTVLLGMGLYIFFAVKGKKIRISYWKYAIPICLPYIPHLLSMTFLNSSDRIMIKMYCGAEDTALYSLAYSCGIIITILLTSLNNAFSPWLGEKLNRCEYKIIKKISKVYVSVFLFLAVGIMLIAPEVLYILGGESYLDAKYVMTPVAMGCVCQFMYTLFVNVEQYKKKTGGMALASIAAALINLGLNYIFIPRMGYLAAAYTTLIGYICLLCMHMFLVYRLGLGMIYDYNFIFVILGIGLVLMGVITTLYGNFLLRYLAIVVYVVILVAFIFKNKIWLQDLHKGK